MKILRTSLLLAVFALFAITLQSCKTRKVAAKPTPPVQKEVTPVEEKVVPPAPVEKKAEPAPVEEKPDYTFTNVLFEFDSGVLKTSSFEVLDKMAKEMKKDPSAKFVLNGHSSIEGSVSHNMSLSVDRANSVKSYLINAGIPAANLTIKGYGAAQPVASNDAEEGRAKNRRVEFQVSR
ncbi:OmpA family protein [Pedobacter frigoris]|uniref:OmpA family protein n=1 Tax=Pedobacter frigoris TaxID=2571272 RepID=A0A4V5P1E6_9SPHI|nr:OmpA family protein [Pedobacter frigoris]TKC06003.1 OmpA family protein [Pedobacter frigoris]